MNNLKKLLSLCKCSVSIDVNLYRDYYESVSDWINSTEIHLEEPIEIAIKNGMNVTQNVIEINCYPFTPISSITIYHYDIDMAIEQMIDAITEWQKEREMP
jgi:hypothetical protein